MDRDKYQPEQNHREGPEGVEKDLVPTNEAYIVPNSGRRNGGAEHRQESQPKGPAAKIFEAWAHIPLAIAGRRPDTVSRIPGTRPGGCTRRSDWPQVVMERRQRMSRGCLALHRLRSEARTCALLALLGIRRCADRGLWKVRRRHEPLWLRYSLSSAEGREQEINRRTDPEYSYGYGFRVSAALPWRAS